MAKPVPEDRRDPAWPQLAADHVGVWTVAYEGADPSAPPPLPVAVNADPAAAGVLCERYQIIPKAAIAQKAIPACNLTFVAGAEMKTQLGGYLNVLFGYSPAAVGGALPDDAFYYAG